jgi:hypothetical protein
MAKFSTGLRNSMLESSAFKTLFANCKLRVYSGAVPADADAAVTGTLLAELSAGGTGTGLNFDVASGGAIPKEPSEVWMTSAAAASGTPSYFRLVQNADAGAASTTLPRVQGTAGGAGADLVMTNPALTAGQPWTLNYFSVGLPTE